MHIRWRGLELPSRVHCDEAVSNERYGRFLIEPFEQGFGTTIGNSLRRVLLASLEGAAVTTVKIAGVSHEFTSIDGVLEDVTDILLNIKGIVLSLDGDQPKTMSIHRETAGEIKAGDVETDPAITIGNPDHRIATVTADVPFHVEMTVRRGRGYATAADNRAPDQELGVIPIDSVFSPVQRVRYRTEDMRVGQRTNYDRLIMEIWTDGTVSPEDALVEAGLILRKHLNALVMCRDLGEQVVTSAAVEPEPVVTEDSSRMELLSKPVSVLNLSVRANNCLEAARVATVGDLVGLSVADLLRFRSFGKTSLHEVQRKLAEHGLSLGMSGDQDEASAGGDSAEGNPEMIGMAGPGPTGPDESTDEQSPPPSAPPEAGGSSEEATGSRSMGAVSSQDSPLVRALHGDPDIVKKEQ